MQNVTREIISDLYVLYSSGDATADSRRLVEEFLSHDPELAASLKESGGTIPILPAPLPPGHELKTLNRIKRRLSGPIWLLWLAMITSGGLSGGSSRIHLLMFRPANSSSLRQ